MLSSDKVYWLYFIFHNIRVTDPWFLEQNMQKFWKFCQLEFVCAKAKGLGNCRIIPLKLSFKKIRKIR